MKPKMKKHQVRLPVHITPHRYKIMLKPDLEEFTFYGEETIDIDVSKRTKEITLHSADLEIDSAELLHKSKDVWAGKIAYNEKAETVTLAFPKTIEEGKGILKIIFRGILNDKMRGFYRSKYMVDGGEKYLATTQFEAVDARRAFPSFDEPVHKAIFDITLMVPGDMTAISNTIPTAVSEHESGYKVVEFAPTPRMSTYLLAFIVGHFEFIEDATKDNVRVRVFTTPGKKRQAQFALEVAVKTLEFYSDYFDIPYPLPVLDLIAIPDFAYGAMENWGAVTYRESTLLVDEELSSSANKQWVALVIAHELAHQWFGNLVTMAWWTHLWLNEGFASFIEYLAIDHLFPQWDIWTQFVFLEKGTALKLDGLKNTHPIEVEVYHPSEINEIFDKVSYSKGASVIKMLADYLGPTDFRNGLTHYLKKHSYANAETSDLWEALEEITGKPVRKIMANWTSKPGYPLLRITEGQRHVAVSQSRFFSSALSRKKVHDKTVWQTPFNIRTSIAKKPTQYLLTDKSITLPKRKADWIKVNAGESSFARIDYPAVYLTALATPIEARILPPVDRLGIIRDIFDLAQSGQLPTHDALSLASSYKGEPDYTVWIELASHLRQIANLVFFESFYPHYEQYCREVFVTIAKKMGWEAKTDDAHTDRLLRGLVLYSLGSYKDAKTITKAQALFKRLARAEKIDPDLRGPVYNLVAENGSKEEFAMLTDMYRKEELAQEKDRIGRALGLFTQKKILEKTLAFSLSKDVRLQSVNGIITAVWTNPNGRDLAWKFVKENWSLLHERFGGGHLLSRLLQPASEFVQAEKAKDVNVFFKKNPVPEAARTIAQAIEQIGSNASWLARDRKGIRNFLNSYHS